MFFLRYLAITYGYGHRSVCDPNFEDATVCTMRPGHIKTIQPEAIIPKVTVIVMMIAVPL